MEGKADLKKIIVLVLIVACIIMFFLPWISIHVNVFGQKMNGYDVVLMSGEWRSKEEFLNEARESIIESSRDAAEEGVFFNPNAAFNSLKVLLNGKVSPIGLLSVSSFASGLLRSIIKAYSGQVYYDYSFQIVQNYSGMVTALAVVLWVLLVLFVASAALAVFGWIKNKKFYMLPLAIASLLWLIVAVVTVSVINNAMLSLTQYGILDLDDLFDVLPGISNLKLAHIGAAGILCLVFAAAAFIVSKLAPSAVDVGATRAISAFAGKMSDAGRSVSGLVSGKWECPVCHSEMGAGFAFCTNCGTARPARPEKKKCPNCGKSLPDDNAFCPYCGTRIITSVPAPVPAPAPIPVPTPVPEPVPAPAPEPVSVPSGPWQSAGDEDL